MNDDLGARTNAGVFNKSMQSFPEFDRVAWFDLDDARARIVVAQGAFLDRLREALEPGTPG